MEAAAEAAAAAGIPLVGSEVVREPAAADHSPQSRVRYEIETDSNSVYCYHSSCAQDRGVR